MNVKPVLLMLILFSLAENVLAGPAYRIVDGEYDPSPIVKSLEIDLDGDKKLELVKAVYGPGVSDKALTIEVFRGEKRIDILENRFGIQANYNIEDIDKDEIKEIILWEGLWDPRMPGEDAVTIDNYEGHDDPHRYLVTIYKLIRGQYRLWEAYTTKKKYESFCEKMPVKD